MAEDVATKLQRVIAFLDRNRIDNHPVAVGARLRSCRIHGGETRYLKLRHTVADRIDIADGSGNAKHIPSIVLVVRNGNRTRPTRLIPPRSSFTIVLEIVQIS